jgi:PadR family transcriptional regulator
LYVYIALCRVLTVARRNSTATRTVLRALLDYPDDECYGFALMRATGLASGTLYPILDRLVERGCVTSRWENVDPVTAARPRRRYYRLTGGGIAEARSIPARTTRNVDLAW